MRWQTFILVFSAGLNNSLKLWANNQILLQIFITSDEKEAITKEIGRVRQWLEEEVGAGTSTDEFLKNKKIIEDLLRPIVFRIEEHNVYFLAFFN